MASDLRQMVSTALHEIERDLDRKSRVKSAHCFQGLDESDLGELSDLDLDRMRADFLKMTSDVDEILFRLEILSDGLSDLSELSSRIDSFRSLVEDQLVPVKGHLLELREKLVPLASWMETMVCPSALDERISPGKREIMGDHLASDLKDIHRSVSKCIGICLKVLRRVRQIREKIYHVEESEGHLVEEMNKTVSWLDGALSRSERIFSLSESHVSSKVELIEDRVDAFVSASESSQDPL